MKNKTMKIVHHNEEIKLDKLATDKVADILYKVLDILPKPEPSMKLSISQKKWWYWFGYEFISTKKISKLDLIHLQKAAIWMDFRIKSLIKINYLGYENGLVQTFRSGATNISAHVSILEKADKHLDEVSSHFGLSIKDRIRLGSISENDTNQLSLFEQVAKSLNNY